VPESVPYRPSGGDGEPREGIQAPPRLATDGPTIKPRPTMLTTQEMMAWRRWGETILRLERERDAARLDLECARALLAHHGIEVVDG